MKYINKIIEYGLYLFVFLLPWQTRWIFKTAYINGETWEYGRWSLYGTEILLVILLILGLVNYLVNYIKKPNDRIKDFKAELKGIRPWVILLVVWSALTIIWSLDKGLAWYGWLKLVEGVGLMWLITRHVARSTYQKIINIIIFSGLIQAGFGIYQFINQRAILANKWLGLAKIDPWNQGTSVIEFLDQRWLRAYGSLPHPNILGGFLAICLLLVIISLWKLNKEVLESQVIARRFYFLNIFYWLSAITIFLGLIVSFSRSAWLAFITCFIIALVYWIIKKSRIRTIVNIKLLIVFCLVFGIFWLGFPTELITTRFNPEARLEKKSIEQRTSYYQQASELFKEKPIAGLGINNYTVALQQKDSTQPAWDYQPVHDTGFLTLVELGIIGLLLFIAIIISALKQKSRYCLLLIAILFLGLFDHYFRSLYFGAMLWWLVLSLSIKDHDFS